MRIISFIEDDQLVKKILEHLDLWDVKRKPPPRANAPPPEAIIIYDESASPSADYPASFLTLSRTGYIMDVDYPIDLSRRSSFNKDGNLPLKKTCHGQSGESRRCRDPKLPKCSTPRQKISVGNQACFRYQNSYWFRVVGASTGWAAADVGT